MLFKFLAKDNKRKMALKIVLVFFIFFEMFGVFAFAKPAQAQMDAGITAAYTSKWTWEKVGKSLLSATLGAVVNGASYFMRKLAYDAAIAAASGASGQKSLVYKQGASAYFSSVFNDASAEFIDSFAQNSLGINICQPANLKVQLNIAVGLRRLYADSDGSGGTGGTGGKGGPKPNCSWQDLQRGAKSHLNVLEDPSQIFSKNLSVDQSDFGIALGAMTRIDRMQTAALASANLERLEGQGYKSVTGVISGNIKSPAQLVKEETSAVTAKNQGQMSAGQIAGMYGTDALNILPMALSTFTNTFVSTLLSNVMKGLFSDKPDNAGTADTLSFFSSGLSQSLNPESNPFTYILTSKPNKELTDFDVVSEFASCDPSTYGIDNCVINTRLQTIIERARSKALTISEAITEFSDFGALPLISPRRVVDNQDVVNCVTNALCYSNIQKLRKARIFPLGLEIAAQNADPDHPELWTLKKVVDGFYDCAPANYGVYTTDPEHPYCHLVDPNWLIKAPATRCATKVYGEQITPGTAERQEECIDWQSCILDQGVDKACTGYGYCTNEKNIWRFDADVCLADFATCKTFNSDAGQASYLARTLDYGECSIDNIGCKVYSTEMDNNKAMEDKWITSASAGLNAQMNSYKNLGRNQTLFFNEKITDYSCGEADEGCSAFYKASVGINGNFVNNYVDDNLIYFKKAPDYLGCYDTETAVDSPGINWPLTRQDLNYLTTNESCNSFAQVCLPEEVGCQAYTPADNGPTVPGVVGNNFCPQICVGYDDYKQEETNFAPAQSPLYFIPSQARTCNANYSGCAEFVNIDSSAQGGEGVEYYNDIKRCEKADYANQGVFYSWEGSANEGYVLRTYKLKTFDDNTYNGDVVHLTASNFDVRYLQDFPAFTVNKAVQEFVTGSPAYVDTAKDKLALNYQICNQERYNIYLHSVYDPKGSSSDCRALYDRSGHVYYRLLGKTVTISTACHPLRKTEPSFFADASILDQTSCDNIKGSWDVATSKCQRCYNGGEYADGYCFYKAITAESGSCPASANGCRTFVGNTGNNIEEVFRDEFEPDNGVGGNNTAKENWSPASLAIKAEALQVGMHSLQINVNEAVRGLSSSTLQTASWYELSFWARGTTQKLNITLKQTRVDPSTGAQGELELSFNGSNTFSTIGDAWREYKLGPIQFTGKGSGSAEIIFTRSKALDAQTLGSYYLDNVRLTELQDRVYAIRDSWKTSEGYSVPLVCDADPYDPLPGQALGCKTYNDSDSQEVYLTGFDKLCREKAVGCESVFDTFNTQEKTASYYNLWCKKIGSADCRTDLGYCYSGGIATGGTCNPNDPAVDCGEGGECQALAKCSVEQGKTGCYLPEKLNLPEYNSFTDLGAQIEVVTSTIIIPADTVSTAPIYLTNYKDFRCKEEKKGCLKVGAEEQILPTLADASFNHVDSYLLNNPDNYKEVLCRADLVGCSSYTNGSDAYFFKDPAKTGNKQCYYKEFTSNEAGNYGWFLAGDIGYCYDVSGNKLSSGQLCTTDSDCGGTNKCLEASKGTVPCYENYLQSGSSGIEGGQYGIWSNGAALYNGLAGQCQAQYDRCTEFVDPVDTTQNPLGQSYYLINDENKLNSADCGGKVSQKNGCVLFDQTDVPKKLFDSAATYKKSNATINGPQGANPNAGTFGLVGTENTVNNDTNVILKVARDRVCSQWLACKSSYYDPNTKTSVCYELGRCDMTQPNLPCMNWLSSSSTILNQDDYINRNITWNGEDYSGYSLYDKYQIDSLLPIEKDGKSYLVNNIATAIDNNSIMAVCKAHPEQTSPFAPEVVKGKAVDIADKSEDYKSTAGIAKRLALVEKAQKFSSANYCQGLTDCSCTYWKTTYKNGELDYSATPLAWKGILDSSGAPCNDDDSSNTCSKIKQKQQYIGSKGFCLEPDLSRPLPAVKGQPPQYACLTWLPLDVVGSGVDNYNNNQDAGYNPATDADGNGQVYCTNATTATKKPYLKDLWLNDFVPAVNLDNSTDFKFKTGINHDLSALNFYNDSGADPVKYVYTIIQNYFWGIRTSTDKIVKHENDNIAVWDFNDVGYWFNFAQRMNLSLLGGSPAVQNGSYDKFHNGEDLYEEDIDKIFFAPFILPGKATTVIDTTTVCDGAFGYCHPVDDIFTSAYITSKVAIKLDEMRRATSCKTYPDFTACGSDMLDDIINYEENSKTDFRVFLFRGIVKDSYVFPAEAGRIRYTIFITNYENSNHFNIDSIVDKVNYFYSGAAPDEENQPVERIMMLIDFDGKTHKYLGITKYGLSDNGDHWSSEGYGNVPGQALFKPYLAIFMQLKDSCTEFSAVTDESGSENKAYTDLVWKNSLNPLTGLGDLDSINKDTKASPFGSTNLTANTTLWWPRNRVDELWVGSSYNHNSSFFADTTDYDYRCININACPSGLGDNTDLTLLFAKVFNVVKRQGPKEADFVKSSGNDKSESAYNLPPVIYSLNPDVCKISGKAEQAVCHAVGEKNNITVNGRNYTKIDYNGDFAKSDDLNKDGRMDLMIGNGFYNATVNFFAWADHNRMPIRKVMVKWGDGYIHNQNLVGKYANHKPYCEGAEDYPEASECMKSESSVTYTGLTCKPSDTRSCEVETAVSGMQCQPYAGHFGNNAGRGACVENYFEFIHTYVCKASDAGKDYWIDYTDISDQNVKDKLAAMGHAGSGVCHFQPAVQVRDNWGWCNGKTWQYYADGKNADGTPKDDCAVNLSEPWTYFKGDIYVIPN